MAAPVTLEFIGMDVARRNLPAVVAGLRRKYPNISETGVHEMAKAELTMSPPRYPQHVVHLFGADILSADLTTIPAWPLVEPVFQDQLRNTPVQDRGRMIDPVGLSRTYVWRQTANWVQEVTAADVDVIRRSEARTWFRSVERHGLWIPHRAWDLPVLDSVAFTDPTEAKRYERDQQRTKQWNGV